MRHFSIADTSVPKMKKRPVSGPAGVVPGSNPVNSSVTDHPARPTTGQPARPSALTTDTATPQGAPKPRVGGLCGVSPHSSS